MGLWLDVPKGRECRCATEQSYASAERIPFCVKARNGDGWVGFGVGGLHRESKGKDRKKRTTMVCPVEFMLVNIYTEKYARKM